MIMTVEEKLQTSDVMFHTIVEHFPGLVFWKDNQSRYLGSNEKFAVAAGLSSAAEIVGKTDYDLPWAASDADKYCADDLYVMVTGSSKMHILERQLQSDGRVVWFDTSKVPLRDQEGEVIGILGTSTDITERVMIDNENIEIMNHLREKSRALEQISTSVIITNLDGSIEYVNPKFTEVTGYTFAEVRGKNPRLLRSESMPPEVYRNLWQTITTGSEWHGEIQNKKKNGELFWESVSISSLVNDAGVTTHYLAVKEDVTSRKLLERQLLQSQKLEGMGTLAGGIAHDFNNLLAMIMGSAELLQHQVANQPRLQKYVDQIIDASEKGISISRQLLVFSRPSQIELHPISLSHTISELQELLTHFLPKTIDIVAEIKVSNSLIMGDSGQIHQAILNLAINAGDAMTNKGRLTISEFSVAPELIRDRFFIQASTPYVAVSITDTGVGMEESTLAKIFDPFFTTKPRGKGTGLGLSMVQGIVKNHNGFIDVVSTPGSGTTFTMYFPAVEQAVVEHRPEAANLVSVDNATILLVDDEENLRDLLFEFLDECGYTVLKASNGTEALAVFQTQYNFIDLVITDLGMPDMGGEELIRRLKKIHTAVRVMVSSGHIDGSIRDHLVQLGVKEMIAKPMKFSDILTAIRRVLDKE
jgi:PAS domain S-box-containing protein